MAKSHSTLRTLVSLILLAIVAAVCTALGNWQLRRGAQRDAIMQAIEAGRKAAPLQLDTRTAAGDLVQWRPAAAHGVWLHDFTVLLDNRNYKGRPGYWVATPLLIDAPSRTAVLVLRGWLPRPILPGTSLPALPRPGGEQDVRGQLVSHVPRMFELWSFSGKSASALPAKLPGPDGAPPKVQNLALQDLSRITSLKLLPAVLEQTAGSGQATAGAAPFVQEWPLPSTDSAQNRGYALQWFSFAGIAGIAWLVVAWRALRRRRQPA